MVGAAILLVGAVVAGTLFEAGTSFHLLASPDTTTFSLTQTVVQGPIYPTNFYAFPAGVAFVPPAETFVFAAEGSPGYTPFIASVSESNLTTVVDGPPCWSEGEYYSGAGSDVFLDCWNSTAESIVVFDAVSGNITRTLPFSRNSDCDGSMAFDAASNVLYCPGAREAYLRAMNLTTGSVVENVSIPAAYRYGTSLWFDQSTRSILYGDAANNTIYRLDPTTGGVEDQVVLPGSPVGMVPDPSRGIVLALYNNWSGSGSSGVEILNESSLEILADVPGPFWMASGVLDPGTQTAYVSTTAGLAAFDVSGRRFLGDPAVVPCPDSLSRLPMAGYVDMDPASGQAALEAQCATGSSPELVDPWFAHPAFDAVVHPSFSAVPWVGTNLPLALGLAVSTFGGAAVAVGFARRVLGHWDEEYQQIFQGEDVGSARRPPGRR